MERTRFETGGDMQRAASTAAPAEDGPCDGRGPLR